MSSQTSRGTVRRPRHAPRAAEEPSPAPAPPAPPAVTNDDDDSSDPGPAPAPAAPFTTDARLTAAAAAVLLLGGLVGPGGWCLAAAVLRLASGNSSALGANHTSSSFSGPSNGPGEVSARISNVSTGSCCCCVGEREGERAPWVEEEEDAPGACAMAGTVIVRKEGGLWGGQTGGDGGKGDGQDDRLVPGESSQRCALLRGPFFSFFISFESEAISRRCCRALRGCREICLMGRPARGPREMPTAAKIGEGSVRQCEVPGCR